MLVVGLAGLVATSVAEVAQAHPVKRFWRYDPDVRKHGWQKHPALKRKHRRWHRQNPDATWKEHKRFHHFGLVHPHRQRHLHRVAATQSGGASWYDYAGRTGACGKVLRGLYAAHRSWPCGAKVSVQRGNRYVVVRILDRGPHVSGRVIDLSREAFERLGDPGTGVLDVSIYHLKKA